MDSNLTRQARKSQKLTINQFFRDLHKLNFKQLKPRIMDIGFLYNYLLIINAKEDLNYVVLNNQEHIKYPLSMMMFGLLRFYDYFLLRPPVFRLNDSPFSDSLNERIHLNSQINKLSHFLQEYMLGMDTKEDLTNILNRLYLIIRRLIILTDNDYEHIFYLAIEFYKEVPFFSSETKRLESIKRLEEIRRKLKISKREESKSFLEKYFTEKYEQYNKGRLD